MKVNSLDFELVRAVKPSCVEFDCPLCGKSQIIKTYRRFFARKNLLCHSCNMKELMKTDKFKNIYSQVGHQRSEKNKKQRSSEEHISYIKNMLVKKGFIFKDVCLSNNTEPVYTYQCSKCGNIDKWQEYTDGQYSGQPFCKKCFVALRSKPEDEIVSYIKSFYFGNIILNTREIIKPKELDIWLPELNLAIEYNGLYWHSGDNTGLNEKTELCEAKGIKLIHIFENEWKNLKLRDSIKNIIKAFVTGIFTDEIIAYFSFTKNNIKYIDRRFPYYLNNRYCSTNPKKLYYYTNNENFVNNKTDNYIYNCGYDVYLLEGADTKNIEKFEIINIIKSSPVPVKSFNDLSNLEPNQKIDFLCPNCNKHYYLLAKTIQNKSELICGRCSQARKMSLIQKQHHYGKAWGKNFKK